MSFASNKRAYGICDITGFRYRLRDMKKTWDGLLVGPDQWSPKHPQLDPKPAPIRRRYKLLGPIKPLTAMMVISLWSMQIQEVQNSVQLCKHLDFPLVLALQR